ncbi:unnamed protein product [Clonostachys rhizophaga]|uniref:Large ribosomal subunit protein mL45 n=1 Tax=Clonostachys rhizophaga TaxID=160324 RepID=A0A9N9VB10_9HYPO|nr:unnamed protein product [Clonostachys rhizophaga]
MSRESRAMMERGMKNEQTISAASSNANDIFFKSGGVPLFPSTFVSLPLSQYPKSPGQFFAYHWARTRHYFTGVVALLNIKLQSMDSWTTRPRWKAQRGKIPPTAKAMYREMLEAFASGDKRALEKLCTPFFAEKMSGAIDRRPRDERIHFEVVKYNKPLFYPRLSSYMISQYNPKDRVNVQEQAIVAIASTQKMHKYSARTGETVPGSVKVQDKVEYVVLMRMLNTQTYERTPWKLWGTAKTTSLESFREEQAAIEKEQTRRAGWGESAGSS